MSNDEKDKIQRIPLEQLETGEIMLRANDALVLNELRNVLTRQAERDLVIADMQEIIHALAGGQVVATREIESLKRAHSVLVRQQVELYERQQIIANVCDAFAERLSETTLKHEKLVEEFHDND
jgi:hypothetical protein